MVLSAGVAENQECSWAQAMTHSVQMTGCVCVHQQQKAASSALGADTHVPAREPAQSGAVAQYG